MLEIKGLSKRYENRVLFEDFNLEVNDGEFVIIVGESGAGKTTLLNMIGGLEDVSSGTICFNEKLISGKKNDREFYGKTVGFLFQSFGLLEEETVYRNLTLVPVRNRSTISIEEAMHRTGIADLRDQKVFRLSGGEQQRVALCRLIIKQCDLILADEPTGNLDPENSRKVMSILREICALGKTVIVVTHDVRLIQEGDRVITVERCNESNK
ncbi:MAG: ATP-binding cassette domain-containing protein [Lachnospiraceae bacterium]|nr:ATP-binding cassette domain-containing protein [Lachnospiraceae bacterium]